MVREFSLSTEGIRMIDPVGYLEFLVLESKASLLLTDSGGLQEEGCILNVPCVTLRENTERPETIDVGSNMLAGTGSGKGAGSGKIYDRHSAYVEQSIRGMVMRHIESLMSAEKRGRYNYPKKV